MNRKTSTMELLEKTFLLVFKFMSVVSCLSFESKKSFFSVLGIQESLSDCQISQGS